MGELPGAVVVVQKGCVARLAHGDLAIATQTLGVRLHHRLIVHVFGAIFLRGVFVHRESRLAGRGAEIWVSGQNGRPV